MALSRSLRQGPARKALRNLFKARGSEAKDVDFEFGQSYAVVAAKIQLDARVADRNVDPKRQRAAGCPIDPPPSLRKDFRNEGFVWWLRQLPTPPRFKPKQ
jgi:hypothetical protein